MPCIVVTHRVILINFLFPINYVQTMCQKIMRTRKIDVSNYVQVVICITENSSIYYIRSKLD